MQKRSELDWVGYVLRDVITFLADNELMQSAQMLAVAAAHIEHDMKGRNLPIQKTGTAETNVLSFPMAARTLN